MRELSEADGRAIAIARDAEINEIAIGEIGAGQHARHAAVHGVEAMGLAEEIIRRFRRAADAGKLGYAVRLDGKLETGLDQRGADGIVPAAGAQGGDAALVIAMREADCVLRQRGMMQAGLGYVGHDALTIRYGITDRGRPLRQQRALPAPAT